MSLIKSHQCKGVHYHFPGCKNFSRVRSNRTSQDTPKPQVPHKTGEDRLKEKITMSDKILQRYRHAERSETEKLVPALEKISKAENSCFGIVGVLLGKYSSLDRWGALSKKCGYILEALLRHETELMKMKEEVAIDKLEEQINIIEQQTEMVHGEGDHLIDYACTSYAEMVVTIEEIQNYHKLLQYAFDWEHAQLMKQREEFEKKTQKRIKESEAIIKAGIRKEMFSMMDAKTREMETENEVMTEILNEYKDEISKKQEAVKTISNNVKRLENDPGVDARKMLFPEMFYHRADCTPDMEFKLDIPIKKYIPI